MAVKIVRGDIEKMNIDAVVAAENRAEGRDDVFVTPGFDTKARCIIHVNAEINAEAELRACYRRILEAARENKLKSLAIPLLGVADHGYSREEVLRIAIEECNSFLLENILSICLVAGEDASAVSKIKDELEQYIKDNYVNESQNATAAFMPLSSRKREKKSRSLFKPNLKRSSSSADDTFGYIGSAPDVSCEAACAAAPDIYELNERMKHLSDTFSEYLLYLIHSHNMENADVYKRAIVDKKIFSKIKNNVDYHPNKLTALCLCVGAELNLDETRDLLARAGYALSPCDKTDIIFSYFIENGIYDMIEIDIQLEEHNLPCIIS